MTTGPTGRPRRPGVGPVRSRETFADLRRSTSRGRSGPVSVSFVERPEWDRAPGGLRGQPEGRERRAAQPTASPDAGDRVRAGSDLPIGAYVVRSGNDAPALEFNELKVAMSQALEKATSRHAATGGPMNAADRPVAGEFPGRMAP